MGLRAYHTDYPTCVTRTQWGANDLHTFDQEAVNDLSDVNAPSPTDQDVFKFDSGTGMWIPSAVPLHKDRHDPEDGADPLDCAAAGTIQPDDAAAEGSAHSVARSDHKHAIVAAAPSDIGVANAEGSGTSFPRNDHVHNIAGQAGEGHIFLPAIAYSSIGQGTWGWGVDVDQTFNARLGNYASGNDGDNVSYKAFLAAGTYTLGVLHLDSMDRGIVDFYIDAAEVASFDTYAASLTYNRWETQTAITVATSGLKTIKFQIDGKHASSSGYNYQITCIVLWRTA